MVGGMLVWFAASTILTRAFIDVSGTITSSITECDEEPDYRCSTTYRVVGSGATEYVAHGNDPSLRRRLPVGTRLVKRWGELSYTINGQTINDFPIMLYSSLCALGVVLLAGGAWRFMVSWQPPEDDRDGKTAARPESAIH
jgi:hypothetical protein